MASEYGLNFGFRRSDESLRLSEGRLKTPVGATLRIGTAVELDPATPGYLKQCAANARPVPGQHGLLVQEENFLMGTYDVVGYDSFDNGLSKPNTLSVVTSGAGVKVWYKNTTGATRADGRVTSTVTMFTAAAVALGDRLGWDGTKWVESDGTTIPHWFVVTSISVSTGYVEAVMTF